MSCSDWPENNNRVLREKPCRPGKISRVIMKAIPVSAFIAILLFSFGVSAASFGDLNGSGDIDVRDVTLAMKHVLALELLSEDKSFFADVNGDGDIDVLDVSLVMRKALGLISSFPDAPKSGTHLITGFLVGDETVTPGKRLVIVTLDVDDPDRYRVTVGGVLLNYSGSINSYLGEVDKDLALREKTAAYRLR